MPDLTREAIEDLRATEAELNAGKPIGLNPHKLNALCDMALRSLPGCVAVPVHLLECLAARYRDTCNFCHGEECDGKFPCLANEVRTLLAAAPGGKGE